MFCENTDIKDLELYGEENRIFHHEQANCNIISHVKLLLNQNKKSVEVVSNDADTFALIVHFCWKWQYEGQIYMRKSDGCVPDINTAATELGLKCMQLLAVHALTGWDTVSFAYGKGESFAVSILLSHQTELDIMGEENAEMLSIKGFRAQPHGCW